MQVKVRPYISYIIFILGWFKSRLKIARGCFINTINWKNQNFFYTLYFVSSFCHLY